MKVIKLTKGYETIVDDEDYENLRQCAWQVVGEKSKWVYASRWRPKGKRGLMHREILGVTDPTVRVDHINGDGLDNRKTNLRVCTNTQNGCNANKRRTIRNTSQYKGVSLTWKKWRAQIVINGKITQLGRFINEDDAARAYNAAAVEHFGEFARLNKVEKRSVA